MSAFLVMLSFSSLMFWSKRDGAIVWRRLWERSL